MADATSPLVTTEYFDESLDRHFAEFRAALYRALWIHGAAIVTANAAIVALVKLL